MTYHIIYEVAHLSIIFFYSKPSITDEEIFFVRLYVSDHDVIQVPRRSFTFSRVVMPDPQIAEVPKVTTTLQDLHSSDKSLFVCAEILQSSQPNGVMS